jgi:glycosyltransferase involved in cell wall biosynthesis
MILWGKALNYLRRNALIRKHKIFIFLLSPSIKGGIEFFSRDLEMALFEKFEIIFVYLHSHRTKVLAKSIELSNRLPLSVKKILIRFLVNKHDRIIINQPGHLKYLIYDSPNNYLFIHNPSELIKFNDLNKFNKLNIVCVANHIIYHLQSFEKTMSILTPPIQTFDGNIPLKRSYRNHLDFIFLGRLVKVKNIEKAIKLVKCIAEIFPDKQVRFSICGEGEDLMNIRDIISHISVVNLKVDMFDFIDRDKLFNVLVNYDFFINLSIIEGMPIAVREAMSVGLIPIVSDIAAHREFIFSGVNGFIVNDKYELTDQQIGCFGVEEYLVKMSKEAEKTVVNHDFKSFKIKVNDLIV